MMNPIPELAPELKKLRLSGILESLERRNREAVERKLAYTEFFTLLIQDEVARRDQKKFDLRLRRAGFRSSKTLEAFDFDFNPKIPKELILDLGCRSSKSIRQREGAFARVELRRCAGLSPQRRQRLR